MIEDRKPNAPKGNAAPTQQEGANPGEKTLSDALAELVGPVLNSMGEGHDGVEMAVSMGVIAWNLAQLPKEEREKEIRAVVENLFLSGDQFGAILFEETVRDLIDQKKRVYPAYKDKIDGFEVCETAEGFNLKVDSGGSKVEAPLGKLGAARPDKSTDPDTPLPSPPKPKH
ncbi:hypothetical protein JW916_16130 [Candidatus Sumerlaeota bacterium]|nr:hypothetical protein [Candidatus Sumerlaeota bacterium]